MKRSWQTVLDQRRKEFFVGRSEQLLVFSENYAGDIPNFMVFAVTGEGGVGKSTLLQQFMNEATSPLINAIVVNCDEKHDSSYLVMGHIANELASKYHIRHKEFDERYKKYRELREEIESDPKAPHGVIDLLAKGVTDFAIKSARAVPGVTPFLEGTNEKAAGETVAELFNYAISRWGNKDEVMLLREPERILTPLFLQLLSKACGDRRLVLMLDVFERTSESLTPWLLALFKFEFGEFDTNICFVIAGRDPLEQHWTELAGVVCYLTLEPFTPDETRFYLRNRGITNDRLVAQIHEDTGGLPVLIELLASTSPKADMPLPDVSKDAVERFLQWVSNEEHRNVALLAAIPRQFNRDLLSAALNRDASQSFSWLSTQSFVRRGMGRGWFYHDKVRELVLRYLRNTVPQDLSATHSRLAGYFSNALTGLNLNDKSAYESETWRKLECERVYHIICASTEQYQSEAVNAFLHSFRWHRVFADEIARACLQCGRESESQMMTELAGILSDIYRDYDQGNFNSVINGLEKIRLRPGLTTKARSEIYGIRGAMQLFNGNFVQSMQDLSMAVEIDPTNINAVLRRGAAYLFMGKPEEAMAAINNSLAADNGGSKPIVLRGLTSLLLGNSENALADFNEASNLLERDSFVLLLRCMALLLVGKYQEAIQSIKLVDRSHENIVAVELLCATANLLLEKEESALVNINNIIEFIHKEEGAIKTWVYPFIERISKVRLMEANKNVLHSLGEKSFSELAVLSITYLRAKRYDDAALYCSYLLELLRRKDSTNGKKIYGMNSLQELMGSFNFLVEPNAAKVICAFEAVIIKIVKLRSDVLYIFYPLFELAASPSDMTDIADITEEQGELLLQMGEYEKAVSVFNQIIASNPRNYSVIAKRGEAYRRLRKLDDAIQDFTLVIDLDLGESYEYSRRAGALLAQGSTEAAQLDIEYVKKLPLSGVESYYNLSIVCALSGEHAEALKMLEVAFTISTIARSYAVNDDLFYSIHNMPEFQGLMEKYHS